MGVLICGSRDWGKGDGPVMRLIETFPPGTVVIHGGARGPDSIAGRLARRAKFQVIVFPAEWSRYGRGAGPIRNAQMLREGKPDIVHAFTESMRDSKGTANMVDQAREAGVRVVVHGESDDFKPTHQDCGCRAGYGHMSGCLANV